MANALDLLSPTVRDLRQEQLDEENQAQRIATMTPAQRNAYIAYSGGRDMGKNLGKAAGGLFGVDTRSETEKHVEGVAAVKDQVQKEGIDPTDLDKFYPRVIQLLAQNRMPAEAAAMQREYQKMKLENRKADLGVKREERLERADVAKDARAAERNRIAQQALGARAPEVLRLLDAAEQPGISEERRKLIIERANMLSKGAVQWKDAGDQIVAVQGGAKTGATIDKGVSPDAELRDQTAREIAQAKLDAKAKGVTGDAALPNTAKTRIAELEGILALTQNAGAKLAAYPKALGFQNYGDFLDRVDRMDPKGVEARAALTNLGSQMIQERSGAAVSAAEMERLRGFVPARTDTMETAMTKLRGMYNHAKTLANSTRVTFGGEMVDYPDMEGFDPNYRAANKPEAPATPQRRLTDKPAPKAAPKAAKEVMMLDPQGKKMWVDAEDVATAKAEGWKEVE